MADLGTIGIDRLVLNASNAKSVLDVWAAENSQTDAGRVGIILMGSSARSYGSYQRLIIPAKSGVISGTVTEGGAAVARTVRCFRRSDGEFAAGTVSDAATGAYNLRGLDSDTEYFVIAFDDDAGEVFDALIEDRVEPV